MSTLTWPEASIPQVALPVTIGGTDYLFEVDEFAGHPFPAGGLDPSATVGAARLIDISDETAPEGRLRRPCRGPRARGPCGGVQQRMVGGPLDQPGFFLAVTEAEGGVPAWLLSGGAAAVGLLLLVVDRRRRRHRVP